MAGSRGHADLGRSARGLWSGGRPERCRLSRSAREPISAYLLPEGLVATDVAPGYQDQPRDVSGRNERFAALVMADSSAISTSYLERLDAIHSPVTQDFRSREQVLAHAAETIVDVVESVRAGTVRIDDRYKLLARTIGESRAETRLSTSD